MVSSLLSQFSNSLLSPASLIGYLGVLEGGLDGCTKYGGSISLLGISVIDIGLLVSISSPIAVGLEAEAPCFKSKRGGAFLLTPALP